MPFNPRLVFVTTSNIKEAHTLTNLILGSKLAACVNILPSIESHYWWQGQIETATEMLLLIKSSAEQFEALSAVVKANHSYENPEIVAVAPEEIAPAYREWWQREGQPPA